ncbi:Hypothetical protein (Fragment) [Durusdinium trenchii]|uniref:Uncharacterized protein n=1 Tax=Durusdinium trenchii TaxID=1381693 RepID=A0ABP0SFI5_9DINO
MGIRVLFSGAGGSGGGSQGLLRPFTCGATRRQTPIGERLELELKLQLDFRADCERLGTFASQVPRQGKDMKRPRLEQKEAELGQDKKDYRFCARGELLAKSIDENKQEMLVTTTEAVKELSARSVEEERFQLSEAEIWLKIGRLQELIDESATQAMDLADGRLRALEDTSIRLRSGLCEVQNVPTRRVTWVIREASKKIRKPLLVDDVKIQPHVSWFSPLFDAGGCHGLQLELQVFRSMDPPVEGQEAGDCAACLWATKGSNLVFKLGVGSRWQLLEKRFNGRVPYGTTRLCFFVDQINREDDTLSVSCEILEVLRELEAPLQPAAPQPPDWRTMTAPRKHVDSAWFGAEHRRSSCTTKKTQILCRRSIC